MPLGPAIEVENVAVTLFEEVGGFIIEGRAVHPSGAFEKAGKLPLLFPELKDTEVRAAPEEFNKVICPPKVFWKLPANTDRSAVLLDVEMSKFAEASPLEPYALFQAIPPTVKEFHIVEPGTLLPNPPIKKYPPEASVVPAGIVIVHPVGLPVPLVPLKTITKHPIFCVQADLLKSSIYSPPLPSVPPVGAIPTSLITTCPRMTLETNNTKNERKKKNR